MNQQTEAQIIVRAWNKEGYHKDVLDQTERQVWTHDGRLKQGLHGMTLDPKDFPEVLHFEFILKTVDKP